MMIANATGLFYFPSSMTTDIGWCSITSGTGVEIEHYLLVAERSPDALSHMAVSGTRFFNVTAGSFTVRLVCQAYEGSVSIYSPALNAIFIPGP
jgi:hypothetical protein